MAYERDCEECGKRYSATRPHSKFCGTSCRVRASRREKRKEVARERATITQLHPTNEQLTFDRPSTSVVATDVYDATHAELDAAGVVNTALGQIALKLARQLDRGEDTGSAQAQLAKELRAVLQQATSTSSVEKDPADELRERRARRARSRG